MDAQLTLMAVHAHPDDESSSTGGVLARYAQEGIRTVLVTCTNGEYGDAPGGIKPGADGHDPKAVASIRKKELELACQTLEVAHLEMLGYSDSGMVDWDYKNQPDVFANVPLVVAAGRISELFEAYRPQVVVTYDDESAYNHPDHVHASRITMEAVRATGIPQKVYYTAMRPSRFVRIRELLAERGVEMPGPANDQQPDPEWQRRMEEAEAKITTTVDVADWVQRKQKALRHHASQMQSSFFDRLPEQAFEIVFGEETFIRAFDRTGVPLPEQDLFAGLR